MLADLGPPDDSQMQAIWIAGTLVAWGLVLAAVVVWMEGGPDVLGIGLLSGALLVRLGVLLTYRWLITPPQRD